MKIVDGCTPHKTEFKNIGIGEVFNDFDTYYMKVPKVATINVFDERIYNNAITLEEDGAEYTLFDEDDEVIPIDAELVIKSKGVE